ncbi:hypothetical protein BCR44DRAFT_33238 [Catenaria anguillulae PL171]|uniref:Uncharacterized protein n=1 Tax=Catenaria anguillulae PL171 TaxID=765915 RepID=A0A1Y2H442_9FUNG|nr:hypothetical protein BCR44DRAFT_33238 [Catenaria anguillulae PL171]
MFASPPAATAATAQSQTVSVERIAELMSDMRIHINYVHMAYEESRARVLCIALYPRSTSTTTMPPKSAQLSDMVAKSSRTETRIATSTDVTLVLSVDGCHQELFYRVQKQIGRENNIDQIQSRRTQSSSSCMVRPDARLLYPLVLDNHPCVIAVLETVNNDKSTTYCPVGRLNYSGRDVMIGGGKFDPIEALKQWHEKSQVEVEKGVDAAKDTWHPKYFHPLERQARQKKKLFAVLVVNTRDGWTIHPDFHDSGSTDHFTMEIRPGMETVQTIFHVTHLRKQMLSTLSQRVECQRRTSKSMPGIIRCPNGPGISIGARFTIKHAAGRHTQAGPIPAETTIKVQMKGAVHSFGNWQVFTRWHKVPGVAVQRSRDFLFGSQELNVTIFCFQELHIPHPLPTAIRLPSPAG